MPVIFATGYSGMPALPPSLAAAETLVKPVGRDALGAAIGRAIGASAAAGPGSGNVA